MSVTILDRKELGLTAFWEKFKGESKASRPVHIRTGCKEWAELPLDMKGLLALAKRRGNVSDDASAPFVLAWLNPTIIREIVKAIVVLAISVVVIYLISKKYKFKIKVNKEGSIEIEAAPA